MSEKVLFLHLSDIHISSRRDAVLERAKAIASATFSRLPEIESVFLVVSGDIAYSGKASEYELAIEFISAIKSAIIEQQNQISVKVFVCPGNHDCNFSLDNDTRDAVLAKIRSGEGPPTTSLVDTATSVQREFFNFRDAVTDQPPDIDSPLAWQSIIKVGKRKVGIRSLNVAWMSKIQEKQGTLVYPASAVIPFAPGAADLTVTLLHHPYNWFSQGSYRLLQSAVRAESQIVFTGHEHVQNVGEIADLRNPSSVFVEGGVLFETKLPKHSTFNIIVVDLERLEYLSELYAWDGERYDIDDDTETWGSLRSLSVHSGSKCKLNEEWQRTLRDPGANFSHTAKKDLELDDFYVWPELQVSDDLNLIKKNVIGSYFVDINNLNAGVLIKGDEKSGKTTLLYQYFKSYYDRGYLPLYFRGAWFTKAHQDAPLRALKFALEKQYERSCHVAYQQASKEKRVLLLDDIDASNLPPATLSECLEVFSRYFENIIVTARDAAAAMNVLSIDRVEALHKFSEYEIREFGHKKRFELVCKWAEVGGDTDVNSSRWMANIDKWEKDLTAAVGRQFVPAVPIFLLTLLQSIEAGRSVDLQNSAFGHYYQFLITSSLNNVGIDREQWAEVFNYCSTLAWYMYSSDEPHVSDTHMRAFTDQYKVEYASEVSYERRIRDLIKAGILTQSDEETSFKYPYLYFYFVGQYIGERVHEHEMETVVSQLCLELQLRDNANILLFACHHTKSPTIYTRIADALDECFANVPCFDFSANVDILNSLVNTAPSLVYHEQPVKESRMKAREEQDEIEEGKIDILNETNAAISKLFRSMEILGQFLKNHYGTTRNPIKDQLIKKVIDGSLRGLHGVTSSLLTHADSIFDYVGQEADKKGESRDVKVAAAKRLLFDITSLVTFAFIHKASSSVGSSYLRDNLEKVTMSSDTLAYSLVEMSYRMDLPDGLSFSKIKSLNASFSKNVFAQALLRTLALKHLHMFKVPYQDKQRLCEELGIALNQQMALQHDSTRHLGRNSS